MDPEETNVAQIPLLQMFEEQRALPRIDMRIPLLLTNENRDIIRGTVRNISPDGLQFRCVPAEAVRLRPSKKPVTAADAPKILVRMSLSLRAGMTSFSALTKLIYMTPRSSDEIAFGAKFMQVAEQHQTSLNRFIFESMEHA